MSASTTPKTGPAIGATLHEIRGTFASDDALQDAVGRLTRAGFDRADLSLPDMHPAPGRATPEQGAANPNTADDAQQIRTLQTSLAGTAGALAAAGAVIATGGAAIPAVAAAALAGLGAGSLANAAGHAGDRTQRQSRTDAAERGELMLSVRIADATRQPRAEAEMRAAGASSVELVGA